MDELTLFMFTVPFYVGFAFSILTLYMLKSDDKGKRNWIAGLICSVLGGTAWIIFGLVWPAFATEAVLINWAYFWYGIGVTCFILSMFYGVQPILVAAKAGDEKTQPVLSLHEQNEEANHNHT